MIIIEESYSLKFYNTFSLPAMARVFVEVNNPDELLSVLNIFKNDTRPKMILGGGSNILFTRDFDGIVIFPDLKGCELLKEDNDHVWVKTYAGEKWDQFVGLCVSKNWFGIENLSLIPGNIGACPIQNIGAYGVEVKDVIESVETMRITDGQIRIFSNAECCFGYRDSIFKHEAKSQYIITAVTFKLSKQPVLKTNYTDITETLKNYTELNINTLRQAIIQIRQKKLPDPEQLGNAGSFFKNPVISKDHFHKIQTENPQIPSYPAGSNEIKVPAAWLIQECGWKGKRKGNVGSYETQPLVIVNYGGATGNEILDFATEIRTSVEQRFGVKLEFEVNIV
jgi:UDP-N-acetylmuramate dehydrogenase